jgi:hypothetical protein
MHHQPLFHQHQHHTTTITHLLIPFRSHAASSRPSSSSGIGLSLRDVSLVALRGNSMGAVTWLILEDFRFYSEKKEMHSLITPNKKSQALHSRHPITNCKRKFDAANLCGDGVGAESWWLMSRLMLDLDFTETHCKTAV